MTLPAPHSSDPQTLTLNWRELTHNVSLSQLFDSLWENAYVFRSLFLFPCLSFMSAYRHIHTHRTTTQSIYHYILSRKCSYLEKKSVYGVTWNAKYTQPVCKPVCLLGCLWSQWPRENKNCSWVERAWSIFQVLLVLYFLSITNHFLDPSCMTSTTL